ncbi:MAG: hypothetical protein ACLFTH_04665 [Candidatus Woesearchaeota archaeon]
MDSQQKRGLHEKLSKQLFVVNTWRLLFALVIVIVIVLQTYFILQIEAPSYESFYGLRQAEQIKETGLPIINDDQSYQGRMNVSHLFFYYILAGLSLIAPGYILFKFFGMILTVGILFLVFLLSKHLFSRDWIALFLTTIAAFTPTLFVSQINTLVAETFFVLLYLLIIMSFFNSTRRSAMIRFIILMILATLVSPLSLVLITGFLFYFLLLRIEGLAVRKKELELLLFSGLFAIWYHLVLYKKLISLFGLQVISQSVPQELLLSMFRGLNVPLIIGFVGVPLIGLGLSGIYYLLFEKRNKKLLLLTAMTFAFGLFTWIGFLPLQTGLLYATVTLVLISGYTLQRLNETFNKTILPKTKVVVFSFFLLLLFLSFTPLLIFPETITGEAPTNEELETVRWIDENLPADSTVLADINDGHLLAAKGGVKTLYDTNFIFAPHPKQRYQDAKTILLSQSEVSVLRLMNRYSIDYVYISPSLKNRIEQPAGLLKSSECFEEVYNTTTTEVYKRLCNGAE